MLSAGSNPEGAPSPLPVAFNRFAAPPAGGKAVNQPVVIGVPACVRRVGEREDLTRERLAHPGGVAGERQPPHALRRPLDVEHVAHATQRATGARSNDSYAEPPEFVASRKACRKSSAVA
jgi:hypothetical protein